MPSYRLELEIGKLLPGSNPSQVMEAAVSGMTGQHVESTDVQIQNGVARILLRFTVAPSSAGEEDAEAGLAASHTREAVGRVAVTGRWWLLRRRRGEWVPIRPG